MTSALLFASNFHKLPAPRLLAFVRFYLPPPHKTETARKRINVLAILMPRFVIARFQLLAIARLFRWRKLQKLIKFILVAVLFSTIYFYVFNASNQSTNDSVFVGNDDNATSKSISGTLNIQVWRGVCDSSIRNLRQDLLFPQYPDEMFMKFNTIEFQIEDNSIDYGQRIFGFVHPPEIDVYKFAIASDDESELWLSLSDYPSEKQLIARVFKEGESASTEKNELNKYPEQISQQLTLAEDKKYYIEVVHKQGVGLGFVQVYWKSLTNKNFKLISSEFLSSEAGDAMATKTKDVLHKVLSGRYPQDLELKAKLTGHEYLQFYALPLIPKDSYLSSCDFKTVSLNGGVHRYQGRKMVRVSRVYPADDSSMKTERNIRKSWPNQVADRNTVQTAVDKIITSLNLKTSK